MLGTDSEPEFPVNYTNIKGHTHLSALYPVVKPVSYPAHGFELTVFPLIMDFTECISIIAKVSPYSINPMEILDGNLKM